MNPTTSPVAHGTVSLLSAAVLLALTAAATDAAPNRRQPAPQPPPPPAETAAPPAPQKKGFFQRLKAGFRRKAPAPAAPETPPPAAPQAQLPPQPQPPARRPAAGNAAAPAGSLANAGTFKPEPIKRAGRKAAPPPAPAPGPESAAEPPRKKRSIFARLFGGRNEPEAAAEVPADFRMERPDDWQDRWIVTDDNVALYEYGPSQAGAPNARLPRGTVVKLAALTRGWTRVELENGQTGYIGSDQLRRAVTGDFADPRQPVQVASRSAGPPPAAWEPAPPPPDLPSMPGNPDMDAALLLLPPLESPDGTPGAEPPELLPGDPFPEAAPDAPAPAPDPAPAAEAAAEGASEKPAEPDPPAASPDPTTPSPAED